MVVSHHIVFSFAGIQHMRCWSISFVIPLIVLVFLQTRSRLRAVAAPRTIGKYGTCYEPCAPRCIWKVGTLYLQMSSLEWLMSVFALCGRTSRNHSPECWDRRGVTPDKGKPATQDWVCYIGVPGRESSGWPRACRRSRCMDRRFRSTIESKICTVHVVLAAHIAVSIAVHTFISDFVQQVFHKRFTIRPRNQMSRRCRQGVQHAVWGRMDGKRKRRPSEIEGHLFKARQAGDLAIQSRRGGCCTPKAVSDHAPAIIEASAIGWRWREVLPVHHLPDTSGSMIPAAFGRICTATPWSEDPAKYLPHRI